MPTIEVLLYRTLRPKMLSLQAMKGKFTFTAHIERDLETGLYVGYIPALPGAHSQAETLDELHRNLEEVATLCLEEITEQELSKIQSEFIGTQQVSISI